MPCIVRALRTNTKPPSIGPPLDGSAALSYHSDQRSGVSFNSIPLYDGDLVEFLGAMDLQRLPRGATTQGAAANGVAVRDVVRRALQ